MQTLKEKHTKELQNLIVKLANKLNNDKSLTEEQYNAIYAIYERKIKALQEGRIY